MKFQACALVFIVCGVYLGTLGVLQTQPQQVHLSLGKDLSEMIVTWVTMNRTNTSFVEYGYKTMDLWMNGTESIFVDGGNLKRTLYIHRVILRNLAPEKRYMYHCGSKAGWSAIYFFNTMKTGSDWSPKFLIYGDMGNVNAQSLPRLQQEVQKGMCDLILHVGDFGYDMDTDNAYVGDEFMRQIESIAAYVPYMTCAGNHERAYNYSNYVNRFSMMNKEGKINNQFYSFDVGPVHFVAFSTELYFFLEFGWMPVVRQYEWLKKDLETANRPENRARRPWIITMGHRPMYCSDATHDDCTHKESIIRKGFPILKIFGLEDLFYKYGVDLELWAHEHSYERLWPVYDRKVYNGSYDSPYVNPKAPVHITTGSAGCQERIDKFIKNPAGWSAARISDYGYTRMTVANFTHLFLEQVSADRDGEISDQMLLVKEKHGPEEKER